MVLLEKGDYDKAVKHFIDGEAYCSLFCIALLYSALFYSALRLVLVSLTVFFCVVRTQAMRSS